MVDSRTISNIVKDRAIPRFVKENHETFVAFMGAYLEFLEQTRGPTDISKNLVNYLDIDNTLDEFVEHFRTKYMVNIPASMLADKRLVAKQIKEFYLNKGNENSYKFLFRILYDADITLFYPKTLILKTSDGKWQQNTSVKIILSDDSILPYLANSKIVGSSSGANAIVESILKYVDRGIYIVEFFLSNSKGAFEDEESIVITYIDGNNEEQTSTQTLLKLYSTITITNPSSNYTVGDIIPIREEGSNGEEFAQGQVIQVNTGPIIGLSILVAGLGYNGTLQEITSYYALPIDWTWDDIYLPDAYIVGDSDNFDFSIEYIFDTFGAVYLEGTGDVILIHDAPGGSGVGARGLVSLVGNDGEILDVELLKYGTPYQAPLAEVVSISGTGADISVSGGGGSIVKAELQQHPIVLESDYDSYGLTTYPDFSDTGDNGATGTLNTASFVTYPGQWIGEDGKLSSIMVLQDSFYYQDFSYVIQAGIDETIWKDTIQKIIHPAGLALFGQVVIRAEPTVTTDVSVLNTNIVTISDDLGVPVEFGDITIATWSRDSNGDISSPVIV